MDGPRPTVVGRLIRDIREWEVIRDTPSGPVLVKRQLFRLLVRVYALVLITPPYFLAFLPVKHFALGSVWLARNGLTFFALFFALAAGGVLAWHLFPPTVEGSGTAATVALWPNDLTHITLDAPGDLIVRPGPPSVRVTADDNVLPHLAVRAGGGNLYLRQHPGDDHRLRPKTPITCVVTTRRLSSLTVSGPGRATVEDMSGEHLSVLLRDGASADLRDLDCESLNVVLWDRNELRVSGRADRAEISLFRDGEVDAGRFRVGDLLIEMNRGGRASVWATDALRARVGGGGTLTYFGAPPSLRTEVHGGRVVPAR